MERSGTRVPANAVSELNVIVRCIYFVPNFANKRKVAKTMMFIASQPITMPPVSRPQRGTVANRKESSMPPIALVPINFTWLLLTGKSPGKLDAITYEKPVIIAAILLKNAEN